VKDKLISQLKERSPQTTAELAKEVKGSWHRVQENLLELCLDGKVRRMIVGGRYLWFYEAKKKGLSAQTSLVPIFVALLILSQAVIMAQTMGNVTNETFGDVPRFAQTNASSSIILNEVVVDGIIPVTTTNSSNVSATDTNPVISDTAAVDISMAMPENETNSSIATDEAVSFASVNETNLSTVTADYSSTTDTTVSDISKPHLSASISNYNATRGGQIAITATIVNDGAAVAKRIGAAWQLPTGMRVVGQSSNCSELEPGAGCIASITLATDEAGIGRNRAKIVLNYE
jgi:hypothetical protein